MKDKYLREPKHSTTTSSSSSDNLSIRSPIKFLDNNNLNVTSGRVSNRLERADYYPKKATISAPLISSNLHLPFLEN